MKLENKNLLNKGWGVGVETMHKLKLGLKKAGYDTKNINIF
ncbi:hydrolase, partial [Acinetobacter baumannii]|nr:hydrolase [Acinetobacter baumannii]